MSRIDLNRAPYFDDFDPSKNYMRVLFRPGRPVQARELNQSQSILQSQIEKFANHVFKNGSKVSNGRTSLTAKAYVRLDNLLDDNSPVDVEQFQENTVLVGAVSGVKAILIKATNEEAGDPPTLFVVYTGTGIDGKQKTFIPGEDILIKDENDITVYTVSVRCPACEGSPISGETIPPTGNAQFFSVDEGIFYFEGMFIEAGRQEIIVQKYLVKNEDGDIINSEPCKLGFDFVQSIITFEDDSSLLDPSLNYPNSTAPGADRYKVELKLVKRSYDAQDGDNFILLCRIGENMRIEFMKSDAEYADLMDMIAKRTYETNGNYTIRPFKVQFYQDKKVGNDPRGWSVNGNEEYLTAVVSPAVGYVKGYRVETIDETPVMVKKARDTKKIEGYVKRFNGRTYLTLRPLSNSPWTNTFSEASLVSNSIVYIYDGEPSGSDPGGNIIGQFKVNDIHKEYGSALDKTAVYRYYIYDLKMTATGKKLSDARSFSAPNGQFLAVPVVDPVTERFEVYNANSSALMYAVDRQHIKTMRSASDPLNGSITITQRKKLVGTMSGSGVATFNTSSNEFFEGFSGSMVAWAVSPSSETVAVNLTSANTTVGSTTLTINLGGSFAGYTLHVIASVIRTNQQEKKKTITSHTYQTSVVPGFEAGDTIMLGKADVFRINSITLIDIANPSFEPIDLTSEYRLNTGVTDVAYTESSIVRTVDSALGGNSNLRLMVSFDYFAHSGGTGYFNIDSYSEILNDPDSGVTYENLPEYISSGKTVFKANNTLDFRPIVIGTDTITSFLPANESTAIFDVEYYLPRVDLLQINKDGLLYSKAGIPSETPVPPRPDENAMVLYEIHLGAYTYSLNDVKTKFIENKRYTMRDIGRLENRIENMEYYVALNLLEKSAADMSITDAQGFDRFKNGFIADNFSDFQAADLTDREFRAGVDRSYKELRPSFKARNKKLAVAISKSTGVQFKGNVAMLPYTEVLKSQNPYATKHLSINPYFQYNKRGTMVLSPNNDVWSDENELPNMVVNIDTGVDAFQQLADATGVLGTDWGTWVDQNRTILGSQVVGTNTTSNQIVGATSIQTNVTTTTTSQNTVAVQQTRTGTATTVESRTDEYSLGEIVRDVQIVPFMRQIPVEFHVTNMKPNTQVWAYFDGVPVSQHCRDIGVQLTSGNAAQMRARVAYGSPLITDANGELRGEFLIPANTFFTGDKKFVLNDDEMNSGDPDMISTSAEASFFAGGLDVSVQDVTLNVMTPTMDVRQLTETTTRIETETVRTSNTTTTETPRPPTDQCNRSNRFTVPACSCATNRGAWWCSDPVAQAFVTDSDMTLTAFEVFFRQFDINSSTLFFEIRTMSNGYPTEMVLGRKEYLVSDLIAAGLFSEDSTVPVKATFDTPIFLEGNTQYCFVVGGYSPNTRIWVSRLGGEVVNIPGKIVEEPPTGQVSFRSLNGTTWNAEQFETIKYNLYGARFNTSAPMKLVFENEQQESWKLEKNPLEFQAGSNRMRVFARDHGFVVNDRVRLSVGSGRWINISATDNLPPQVGQTIHTVTGSAKIAELGVVNESAGSYRVRLKDIDGVFNASQQFTADPYNRTVRDPYLATAIGSKKPLTLTINEAFGTFTQNSYHDTFTTGSIAGVPVNHISKQHIIVAVDSMDSFIVELPVNATQTGRFGGEFVEAYDFCEKYELFNVSGSYLNLRGGQSWTFRGVGHGLPGDAFEGENYTLQQPIAFLPGQDKFLGKPFKLASRDNETRVLGSNKSIQIEATFTTSNEEVSPMVNIDTFSVVTVSNRVENQTAAKMNVAPNDSDRFVPETHGFNGSATYKYVTKPILLRDPANELMIYFDVYKDKDADFDVYIKKITPYETREIEDVEWLKVEGLDKSYNSFDLTDRVEYEIKASEHVAGWMDENEEPIPFTAFKIKIVGRTRNSAKPPLFKALRGIAVT